MSSFAATPGFSWSLPKEDEAPPPPQTPLVNPFLHRKPPAPSPPATEGRSPFSPMTQNGNIRQRRRQPSVTAGHKMVPPPPKASYLMGDAGIENKFPDFQESGRKDGNQSTLLSGNNSLPDRSDLERWVVVYGFMTQEQYDLVIRKFHTFGKIVSQHHASGSNWIAFEYENLLHTEKALCQQHSLLVDGILIGTVRLTETLKASLDWNSSKLMLPPPRANRCSRLDDNNTSVPRDDDILLLENGPHDKASAGKYNPCEAILGWVFGW